MDLETAGIPQTGCTDNTSLLYSEKFTSAVAKAILDDLKIHKGKAVIIAGSTDQARELKRIFDFAKAKTTSSDELWNVYLYTSLSTPDDRGKKLKEFKNSLQGVLIVVDMAMGAIGAGDYP